MIPVRTVGWLMSILSILLLAACSGETQEGDGADRDRPDAGAAQQGDDVADRVLSLGQRNVAKSPGAQEKRLANGLAPLADTPLFLGDYADPFVLAVDDDLFLYTSNTVDHNVPVLTTEAGGVAEPAGDALPKLPSWTEPGLVWAPSVLQTDDGGFVLYYTSLDSRSGLQCVGAAQASSALGPFVDDSDDPFVCQRNLGGTIDASPFVGADGTPYLLYKNDGNCCDITTQLWTQQLAADGMTLAGDAVALLETTEDWEGPLIEGPSMTMLGDSYWLLYSANDWNSADYAVGLAECESPVGPCTKRDGPWLANHGEASGPGGAEDFTDAEGRRWMVYHAWVTDKIGYEAGGERSLFAVPLDLRTGEPAARGLGEDGGAH